jgi:hAT family C-terminal dimerisation region
VELRKEKAFTSARNHKRLKTSYQLSESQDASLGVDLFDQFIETDVILLAKDECFDPIQYWHKRNNTQTDLARMALDALAVPAMSDECERLFSSAKILLNDHRSRLKIDIIEASECLRAWYGPPTHRTFDDKTIGVLEGEPPLQENEDTQSTQDTSDADEDAENELQILDMEWEREAADVASCNQGAGANINENDGMSSV